jgi:hypothetical protein
LDLNDVYEPRVSCMVPIKEGNLFVDFDQVLNISKRDVLGCASGESDFVFWPQYFLKKQDGLLYCYGGFHTF